MKEGYLSSSTGVVGALPDGGTEGARRATGVSPSTGGAEEPVMMPPPDPEVPEKTARRRFTAKFKLQILQEADACTEPGRLGAFLRSKGLYSSNREMKASWMRFLPRNGAARRKRRTRSLPR
jgi:hypothetical protein